MMADQMDQKKKPLELAIRKFVFSSFRVFNDVERRSAGLQNEPTGAQDIRATLFRASRTFREHLSALLSDIDLVETAFMNQNNMDVHLEANQPEYDLAAYLVTTWHLCEIFFLNQNSSNSLETIHWFKMNGVLPIDQKATLEVFRSVRNPQNIQQAQITDDLKTFWSSIYALILEGNLMGAWEILSLHGDLASIITSTDMNNDSDRDTLEAIYDVLSTHPYIDLVDSLAKNNSDEETMEIAPTMALEFKDWQEKVSSILQRQPPLLGRVSELNTVLYLLIGDKDTLIAQAGGEWTSLGVGLFLYVHPPPLIRANISKIVKSAMSMVLPRSDISHEDRAKEIRQRETMCKIMNGDASLVLKSLVEVCGWGSDLQDQCSLFGLLSASHLTYLLAQSGVAAATSISTSPSRTQDPNFSRGLPSGAEVLGELLGGGRIGRSLSATLPEESSFVEELLLESAQRLNKLQFPLDIVTGYLGACPLRGSEHARALLPRRRVHSDSEVHSLCRALRSFGLSSEASAVEASRGSWWLQQRVCSDSLSSGGQVVKALRFYQLAQDWDRTNALLDRTLWRCITALINVSAALTSYESSSAGPTGDADARFLNLIPRHLRVLPVYPRGAALTGENAPADYWDLRHYPESRSRPIATLEGHGRSLVGDTNALDDSVEIFFSAIGDAEEMLGALLVPEVEWGPEGVALKKFVCVVRALLTGTVPPLERTEWTNTLNLTQGLIGTPLESWKTMCCTDGGEGGKERVLRFASETLCSLIKEETAPMRFWLPILELCVGLDNIMDRKECACLFSRGQAYDLLEASARVLAVHSNYTRKAPPGLQRGQGETEAEEENTKSLRIGLLGILSGAVIQSNADSGYTRTKNNEEIRSFKLAEYQKLTSPVEKTRQYDALEMLSISAFL